jgi:hypothetical protein
MAIAQGCIAGDVLISAIVVPGVGDSEHCARKFCKALPFQTDEIARCIPIPSRFFRDSSEKLVEDRQKSL